MEMKRCRWVNSDPLYVSYHDEEWGRPVKDDRLLFERISLEGMQAGLSWITVLKKRENFRKAFYDFDIDQVARMDEEMDVARLMLDSGLIRSQLKLRSVIRNARQVQKMQQEGLSLTDFLWSFAPDDPYIHSEKGLAQSPESEAMSKALKKRGFSFIGPVICYALMQATGMVQDHLPECEFHQKPLKAQK